tara:strand:- start:326 stop:679 length:354 start_codon:yes stop_codon:yes gene_type:complete
MKSNEVDLSKLKIDNSVAAYDRWIEKRLGEPIIKEMPFILVDHLDNTIGADDHLRHFEYINEEIIAEAKYVQEKYDGGIGFEEEYVLNDPDANPVDKKLYRKELREIKKYIKKWEVV